MPRVSVVIATYNRVEFVSDAIESVQKQTYDDLEIVVVDDGSTDGTRKVLSEYENTSDIRVLYNDENVGQCYSKNKGSLAASGEYLAFLDDDDEWHPTKIERQVERHEALGEEFGAVTCGVRDVTADGEVMGEHYPSAHGDVFPEILITNSVGPISAVLFDYAAFEAVNGFADDCPPGNDWELYIRFAQQYRIASLDSLLVDRRIHDENVSGDPEYDVRVREMVRARYNDIIEADTSLERRFEAVAEKERGLLALERGNRSMASRHLGRSTTLEPTPTKAVLLLLSILGPFMLRVARHTRDFITGCNSHSRSDSDAT